MHHRKINALPNLIQELGMALIQVLKAVRPQSQTRWEAAITFMQVWGYFTSYRAGHGQYHIVPVSDLSVVVTHHWKDLSPKCSHKHIMVGVL